MSRAVPLRASTPSQRVLAVDLLRFVVTLQMVHGHAIDAVLLPSIRRTSAFAAWEWTRGLTSVAFLFAAGLSFHFGTLLRLETHAQSPALRTKRLRRGLALVGIGYLLHLPIGATSLAEAWRLGTLVDILQCIGVTLVALEVTTRVVTRARHVSLLAACAAPIVLAASLATDAAPTDGAIALVANYLTRAGGSLFPLLPWSAHLLAGVALGPVCWPAGPSTPPRTAVLRLSLVAALLLAAGAIGSDVLPLLLHGLSLGSVVAIVAFLTWLARDRERLSPAVDRLASESLSMYVFHIVIVYNAALSLATVVGRTQSWAEAHGWGLLITAATALAGWVWSRAKERRAARGAAK